MYYFLYKYVLYKCLWCNKRKSLLLKAVSEQNLKELYNLYGTYGT